MQESAVTGAVTNKGSGGEANLSPFPFHRAHAS